MTDKKQIIVVADMERAMAYREQMRRQHFTACAAPCVCKYCDPKTEYVLKLAR